MILPNLYGRYKHKRVYIRGEHSRGQQNFKTPISGTESTTKQDPVDDYVHREIKQVKIHNQCRPPLFSFQGQNNDGILCLLPRKVFRDIIHEFIEEYVEHRFSEMDCEKGQHHCPQTLRDIHVTLEGGHARHHFPSWIQTIRRDLCQIVHFA